MPERGFSIAMRNEDILGDAGKRKLQEEYAAERLLDRLLEIYEKVIMEREGRRRVHAV